MLFLLSPEVQAEALCKQVLVRPLSEDALQFRTEQLRQPAFFLELLKASPEFRTAIRAFVNVGTYYVPRLRPGQDAADHFLAYVERVQSFNRADDTRLNVIDTFVSERVFEIEMRHHRDIGPQLPRTLSIDAGIVFGKDDPGAFQARLLALARRKPCYLRLGREKQERNNIRSALERNAALMPRLWVPKDEATISWIPEDVRNTEYLFAIIENSETFRKVILTLAAAAQTADGLNHDSGPGEFYLALIDVLHHPGRQHRYALTRTVNHFVLSVLEMALRNTGSSREQLHHPDGTLRSPRTFGGFAEALFNRDTRENWGVVFREVLYEDDHSQPLPESFILPKPVGLVESKDLKKLWSQVAPQISYLDGQVVDLQQQSGQVPKIVQTSIINAGEAQWTKAFDERLKQIDSVLREFQEYQNVVFEFQIAYSQRAPEQGPAQEMDDEAFRKWSDEFARHRIRNFHESSFSLGYFRTLATLAKIMHQEWNQPRNGPAERKRLLEIVRYNILPPMKNVEFAALIQRFRRLLLRGRQKVVDYDAITIIFRDIDRSDDFTYKPGEVLRRDRVEALTNF